MLHALASAVVLSAKLPFPQGPERPPWAPRVEALFSGWDRPDSPGCALGVIQDGELVLARGFGAASLEHGAPITPATVFDIGSTSKQFTAAAIGLLAEENRLGVEDDVRDWVPELRDFGDRVTLDHLLHHTSGLPDYLGLLMRKGARTADWTTPAQALAALAEVKTLGFTPGERFEYSNSNYFLLSLVGERASEIFSKVCSEGVSMRGRRAARTDRGGAERCGERGGGEARRTARDASGLTSAGSSS